MLQNSLIYLSAFDSMLNNDIIYFLLDRNRLSYFKASMVIFNNEKFCPFSDRVEKNKQWAGKLSIFLL